MDPSNKTFQSLPELEEGRGVVEDATDPETRGPQSSPTLTTSTTCSTLVKDYTPHSTQNFSDADKSERNSKLALIWSGISERLSNARDKTQYKVRRLDDCPKGYPSLAAFLDSDEGYTLYRRFGYLQSRLLLEKQDELRQLEQKLDQWDEHYAETCPKKLMKRVTSERSPGPRNELMENIEKKFCEYSQILTAAQQMMAFNRPSCRDFRSVLNHVENKKPVLGPDASWVYCKEDLITLRAGREHAWLDDGIEHLLKFLHCGFIEWIFCDKYAKQKSGDEDEVYYTRSRIDRLVNGILTFLILVLLVVPVYILYHMINEPGAAVSGHNYAVCIGVLLVFTLAFSAVLSLFTRAKRHEILAAAAAYCAVLVVFLGNVGPNSGPH